MGYKIYIKLKVTLAIAEMALSCTSLIFSDSLFSFQDCQKSINVRVRVANKLV